MANASEQSTVVARAGKPFTFTRKRGNAEAEFFPGAGARLRFASNDTDVLTLPGLPVGLLTRADVVIVQYEGATVFRGTVATRVERQGRGTDRVEDVTVEGPWGLMARLVFRQEWQVAGPGGQIAALSSNLVLNQAADGVPQDMSAQVFEIADYAAGRCGFACAEEDIDAGTQQLPADEARDITCSAAIMRTLRFFPQTVCRFDYSPETPSFHVSIPPTTPATAGYLSTIPKTQRSYTRIAHPVVGVDISTEGYEVVTGDEEVDATLRKLTHQTAGVTDSIDTLHIFLPLAKGSSSTSWESMDVETIPGDTYRNLNFWIAHHPALDGFSTSGPKKVEFAVAGEQNIFPSSLPISNGRLTDTTVGDLRRFGLQAEVVRMTANVKITTPEKEETLVLTLDWVCTDAETRTYTQQTGSSSAAGETLPDGLAEAILAQRGGEVMGEEVTIRLGDDFPTLGDADVVDGNVLYLQSFEVDCYDLTARLHFGRPSDLSPEDMRDLLLGFRQRGFASNTPNRNEPDADDNMGDVGGVQPITSSSIVVSSVKKATIQGADGEGKIVLDAAKVAENKTIEPVKLTYTDSDGNEKEAQFLGTEDIDLGAIAGADIEADPDMFVEVDDKTLYASVRQDEETGTTLVGLTDQAPDDENGGDGYCNRISNEDEDFPEIPNDISNDGAEVDMGGGAGDGPDGNVISRWPCKKEDESGGES